MKLLNDQGKILGLITPLDLALIVVIALIGAKIIGVYRPISPKHKERQVTVGIIIRDASPYLAESLVVGQDLFDDATGAYLGKIRVIRSEPAELLLTGNGEIRLAKSPRNLDLRLEISKQRGRIETGLARSGVYLGKIAARVGNPVRAHTRYTAISGEIIWVRIHKP
jgi:hypothetical protein